MKILVEKRELIGMILCFQNYPINGIGRNFNGKVIDVELDMDDSDYDPTLVVKPDSFNQYIYVSIDSLVLTQSIVKPKTNKDLALVNNWMDRYWKMLDTAREKRERYQKVNLFKQDRILKRTSYDLRYTNLVSQLLDKENIKYFEFDYAFRDCVYIRFSDYKEALKASKLLEKANMHHCFYRDSYPEKDSIYSIVIGEYGRNYDPLLWKKFYLDEIADHLGNRLLRAYDKAFNMGINSLSNKLISQINKDLYFMINVVVEETGYKLPIVTLIDGYFTSSSTTESYFTNWNFSKEDDSYSQFISYVLFGMPFPEAFLASIGELQKLPNKEKIN